MKKWARKLFFHLLRYSKVWCALSLLLLLGSVLLVAKTRFSNDIARMLPEGSESMQIYRKTADSNLYNKGMILFSSEKEGVFDTEQFRRQFRLLASNLAGQKKYIRKVDSELFLPGSMKDQQEILLYCLSLTAPEELPSPERLIRSTMRQLVMLSSTGRTEMIRLDPAGLTRKLYGALQRFQQISGHNAAPDSPFIMTSDHKNVLLVMDTIPLPSDPSSGRILESLLEKEVKKSAFDPAIRHELILPHKRAVANEEAVRRDVKLSAILSIILFTLITVFLYKRDLRSFLIILLPAGASLAGGALVALLFANPQFYVLGLGGVIVSIAVDYGIHIYTGMKQRNPIRALYKIMPSLLAGMITSAAAFFIFVFSSMEAVRQLGFFAGCSLFLSLFLILIFLPWITKRNQVRSGENLLQKWTASGRTPSFCGLIFILLWIICVLLLPRLRLRTDVRQYDLSPESLQRQEEKVGKLFQNGKSPSLALFEGKTPEEALAKGRIAAGKEGFFTLLEVIPETKVREGNFAVWKTWDLRKYAMEVRRLSAKNGFGEGFFDPFLQTLEKGIASTEKSPALPGFLQALSRRFLLRGDSGVWYSTAMYEESFKEKNSPDLQKHATLLSRKHVPHVMARDIMQGILPCACGALLAVLLITIIYFRSFTKALLALLPAGSALLVTGGVFALIGKEINIPVAAGAVILCGLSVDYGIFVLHAVKNRAEKHIYYSVTLSALTTFAGGLTVAFSKHPMLRDGGITLLCGILVTWATALFFLPGCIRKKQEEEKKEEKRS